MCFAHIPFIIRKNLLKTLTVTDDDELYFCVLPLCCRSWEKKRICFIFRAISN